MDLQKIAQEAVKAASQAGTVNFNFNDIHHNQNVFLGADGKVGGEAKREDGFDIEAVPVEHFDFFRWVSVKEARREVMQMRSALAREVKLYDDISHRKTPLMLSVIEPLVLADRLKHVPTHPVLEALFGDVIDGYSRQAHTKFREELGRKYLKFRPKRKGL